MSGSMQREYERMSAFFRMFTAVGVDIALPWNTDTRADYARVAVANRRRLLAHLALVKNFQSVKVEWKNGRMTKRYEVFKNGFITVTYSLGEPGCTLEIEQQHKPYRNYYYPRQWG